MFNKRDKFGCVMKDENKKDDALNELFGAYMEECPPPPQSVTCAAKAELGKRARAEAEEKVPAVAATGASGASGGDGRRTGVRLPLVAACAAAVLVAAAVLIVLLVKEEAVFPAGTAGDEWGAGELYVVEMSQLEMEYSMADGAEDDSAVTEGAAEWQLSAVAPFISKEDMYGYAEYSLSEDGGGFSEGDVVLCRIECTVPPGVAAVLYVEADGLSVKEFAERRSLGQERSCGGKTFTVGAEGGEAFICFTYGGYGYCVLLEGAGDEEAEEVLEGLAQKL